MDFTAETTTDGVLERLFSLDVGAERVPGVIWSRATNDATPDRPIVLFGHGGTLHKKIPYLVARAHRYVTAFGYTVVAIDAPNHGERPVSERASRTNAEMAERRKAGKPIADLLGRELAALSEQTVPEWKATLDAVQALPEVGSRGRVGYWGMSMGGAIGLSLVAAEPRIRAAVLGLIGLISNDHPIAKAAAQVEIPIEFVLQWHDEVVSRESGLALFNAIASPEKTLHINPGKHVAIPAYERESWQRFYQRHLLDVPIDAA
jgi:dienelactone hydrolase